MARRSAAPDRAEKVRSTLPRRAGLVLAAALAFAPALAADDIAISTDEAALFGDADAGVEKAVEAPKGAATAAFLKTQAVRIGGSFSGVLEPAWKWTDPWNHNANPGKPDSSSLGPQADAKIFFDARPDEQTRYYGSVKAYWPYGNGDSSTSSTSSASGSSSDANVKVFELFADFAWQDKARLRFGKQTAKWGVGYFWSPADVINLNAIDVLDPTAQLEGPVALRVHVPVPKTQNNFWAYALLPQVSSSAEANAVKPADLGWAGKYEFLVEDWEIGSGGFYMRGKAPKGMLTATGSVWKLGLFGEAVWGWGSDKQYIDSASLTGGTPDYSVPSDGVRFRGTGGFSYLNSTSHLSVYGQYYYNGDTYSDADRKDLIAAARSALDGLSASPAQYAALSAAVPGLIYQSGRHYAALSVSRDQAFLRWMTLSCLAAANLSDLSGFVQPSIAYEFFDGFSLSLSPTFVWTTDSLWGAGDDGEYAVLAGGPSVTLALKAKLGSGNF